MTEKSNNEQAGYAGDAYPLAELLRPPPSLPGLQAFVAAARLGSVSRAAAMLYRSQGAISRQIQALEAHYGVSLLARGSSGVVPTADGAALLPVATAVLEALLRHRVQRRAAVAALKLRLPSTLAVRWFLPRLTRLREALGEVELALSTRADDGVDFGDGSDAQIVRGSGPWPGAVAVPLFAERLTPLCTPARAAALATPADLARQPLLHPGATRAEWSCWLDAVGVALPPGGMVLDTLELTLAAAAAGHGVAIGDPRFARDRLADGSLCMPFDTVVANGQSYFLVYPRAHPARPALDALGRAVLALAAQD